MRCRFSAACCTRFETGDAPLIPESFNHSQLHLCEYLDASLTKSRLLDFEKANEVSMFSRTYEIEASVLVLEYLRDMKNSKDLRNTWTVSSLRSVISTLQSNFTQIRLLSIENLHVFNQHIFVRIFGIHNHFPQSISGRK